MNNKTRVQYLLLRKVLQQKYGVPTNVMNQMIWFIPPECKGEILEWEKWEHFIFGPAIVWYDWMIFIESQFQHLIRESEHGFYCEYCLFAHNTCELIEYCANPQCGLDLIKDQDYIDHFKNE